MNLSNNKHEQERKCKSGGPIPTLKLCRNRQKARNQERNHQKQDDQSDPICKYNKNTRVEPHIFNFDHVFDGPTKQSEVYDVVAKPVLENVFQGWNGTIFAYGQTSSGKTFTMQGAMTNEKLKGIIPRIVDGVFEYIDNSPDHIEFIIKVSMLEIYMESLTDLLNINGAKAIKIRETPTKGIFIENLVEPCVGDESEVMEFLAIGNSNRKIGRTDMNAVSSRSHLVTILNIQQQDTEDGSVKKGKLYLVDLAGSEKVGKTGVKGLLLEQAKLINKSLLCLGNVISALTEGSKHIPYR